MDYSQLPEPVRRRLAEFDAMPPIETARKFVRGYLSDADSIEEIRTQMRNVAITTDRGLRRELAALETVLAQPQPEGTLAHLVGWVGNWVLDDPSDRGAAAFLAELAEMLRTVIAEAESARR